MMKKVITEKDIKDLREKQKLEFYAVRRFLDAYNVQNKVNFQIIELSDSPDCRIQYKKEVIGIEITHVYYNEEEARTAFNEDLDNVIVGPMTNLGFTEMINESIIRKTYNDYGKRSWLLIRTASLLYNEDSIQRDLLQIPPNKFEQIWLTFRSTDNIYKVK